MSKFKLLIGVLFFCQLTFAGEKIGNGGGAWICRENDQTISKAELTDLWEAVNLYQLRPKSFPENDIYQIVASQIKRLKSAQPAMGVGVQSFYTQLDRQIIYTDAEIIDTQDGVYQAKPPASFCKTGKTEFFQVANFTEQESLLISKIIWDFSVMPVSHKAGLLLHEAIYRYMRLNYQDTVSLRTRMIVGLLFSEMNDAEFANKLNYVLSHSSEGQCQNSQNCDYMQEYPSLTQGYESWVDHWQVQFEKGNNTSILVMYPRGNISWPWNENIIHFTGGHFSQWTAAATSRKTGRAVQVAIELGYQSDWLRIHETEIESNAYKGYRMNQMQGVK